MLYNPMYLCSKVVFPPELLTGSCCFAEVMRDTEDGVEIIRTSDLPPEDLLRVIEMRQVAFAHWWAPGHPGWGIVDELTPASTNGKILLPHYTSWLPFPAALKFADEAMHFTGFRSQRLHSAPLNSTFNVFSSLRLKACVIVF